MGELIEFLAAVVEFVGEVVIAVVDLRSNRNARGRSKCPSEKYVSR